MKAKQLDLDPATSDPDGLSDGVSTAVVQILLTGALTSGADLDGLADNNSSAGVSVTIDGALAFAGGYVDTTGIARHIHIVDTGNDAQTGATYTITGTGSDKRALVEAITGPAALGFVITTGRFLTVTSIAIASPVATSTVDIGVNGVFVSADGLGRQLSITDTGTDVQTTATYAITGTDADDRPQTTSRAGPGSTATVVFAKFWKTVTSVVITSPVATSTSDLGTTAGGLFASKMFVLDHYADVPASIQVAVTGTINFDVETTMQNPLEAQTGAFAISDQSDFAWLNDGNFASQTASSSSALASSGLRAFRVVANSFTAGAELQLWITQPRGHV